MCDIGCGYGGLTKVVSEYLQAQEVYGIDIDEERLQVVSQRGIKVFRVDIEYEKLPFPDEYFDLVTSFGVLEHLKHFDNFFTESYRVLRKGGFLIISMPNLGSWINRIALLLGFQPRDVEVSCRVRNQGFLPIYSEGYIGHVHSATLRAMRKILEFYNFQVVKVQGSSPYMETKRLGILLKMLDKIFSNEP